MTEVLRKSTSAQLAKPLAPTKITPPQMAPVSPLPELTPEAVQAALAAMDNETRAAVMIGAILRNKHGRSF